MMWRHTWQRPGVNVLFVFAVVIASFLITLLFLIAYHLMHTPRTQKQNAPDATSSVPQATVSAQTTAQTSAPNPSDAHTVTPAAVTTQVPIQTTEPAPFIYSFNVPTTLYEAGNAKASASRYWFLDSGGKLIIKDGYGETIQGSLASDDPWRELYARDNPTDTDNGYHPQNIFRLLTQSVWDNAAVEADFKITNDNFSASPNRNASNGLLLMTRYQDHNTLYYAGIRVDGQAVIKKKYHGTYYTMAEKPFYSGTYNHQTNPNLLPHGTWIGLKSATQTLPNGSVDVTLSIRTESNPSWTPLLVAHDNGRFGGTPPITASGNDGIRTDFMDVLFKNFRIDTL